MKDDKRKRLIEKCKHFAKKNEFCLTLATVYIFCVIVVSNIYSHFKKAILITVAAVTAAIILICCIWRMRDSNVRPEDTYISNDTVSDAVGSNTDVVTDSKADEITDNISADASEKNYPDETDSDIILVNKTHPIPDGYEPDLVIIENDLKCDRQALEPITSLIEDAEKEEIKLVISSAYRDYDRQKDIFDKKVRQYMLYGYSYAEAYKKTATENSIPGSSEHEIGLAFDIVSEDHEKMNEEFGSTDAGKWLDKNCYRYGFIIRYPKGKEEVTGIIYEPWHIRYVGVDAAKEIYKEHITLEEYLERR
ncbi:MAG: M15 family metallopeptidase [Lachnospiraceae bacterium]|nr:M15 family metallopeptidase [Lachnospiraceae bacterium]